MVTLRPVRFYSPMQINGLRKAFDTLRAFASAPLGDVVGEVGSDRRGAANESLQALQERLNQHSVKAFFAAAQRDLERLDRSSVATRSRSGERTKIEASSTTSKQERLDPSAAPASPSPTFDRLLANGDLLSGSDFEQRLGCKKQAVSQAVKARRYFYVEVSGKRAYPAFFVDPKFNRRDLEAVSKLLGDISGGSKYLFFTTPKGSLALAAKSGSNANGVARTPLQALAAGDLERVKQTARGYAQA